jgi:succinate dehydrogenase/fumarate reductase cytochrome b subunit
MAIHSSLCDVLRILHSCCGVGNHQFSFFFIFQVLDEMLGNNSLFDEWSNRTEVAVAIRTVILFQFTWILQICIDFQANPLLKMFA